MEIVDGFIPAIVFAFGQDEHTVADWQLKAGRHAKTVQQQVVCQGQIELGQVQADELYTKTQAGPVWVATALTVFLSCGSLVEPVIEQYREAVFSAWITESDEEPHHHPRSAHLHVSRRTCGTSAHMNTAKTNTTSAPATIVKGAPIT
jgi:hypothetical protein